MSECSYAGVRHEAFVRTVRVSVILLLLHSDVLDCTTDHRKVPHRVVPHQETRAEHGQVQGSWGTWGPWSSCSRSCARGVQEQRRPCLHTYPPSEYPTSRTRANLQQPGRVISALRPTVPLHDTFRSFNSSSGREPRRHKVTQPGGHRDGHMIAGRYGYGRAPSVVTSQTDRGQDAERERSHRQRRSAEGNVNLHASRRHGDLRANHPITSTNLHRHRPYIHPRVQQPTNNQVWAPLYQPGSAGPGTQAENQQAVPPGNQSPGPQRHQERPYDPLPVSSCNGEHVRYKICSNNACPPASRGFRAVQCSSYNNKPFMGRLYEWEPFNEVPVDQQCELNCRAIGFRFYVRLSEAVTDGTPCGQNDTTLCVSGKCAVSQYH